MNLEEIKARHTAATTGPWAVSSRYFITHGLGNVICSTQTHPAQLNMDNDLAFIAHARTDVPGLVAEVERLRQMVETLGSELRRAEQIVRASRQDE